MLVFPQTLKRYHGIHIREFFKCLIKEIYIMKNQIVAVSSKKNDQSLIRNFNAFEAPTGFEMPSLTQH